MTNTYIVWAQNKRAMVKECTTDLDKAARVFSAILKSGKHAFITVNFVSPQVQHFTPQQIRLMLEAQQQAWDALQAVPAYVERKLA